MYSRDYHEVRATSERPITATRRNHLSIKAFGHAAWTGDAAAEVQREAAATLERGDVLFLPELHFEVSPAELQLFSPAIVGSSKNIGFEPATARVSGTVLDGEEQRLLADMLGRYSRSAAALVHGLVPFYRGEISLGRTSFRPVEIAGRETSWRKDDTRLHVDAFPASPVRGRRILRVFTNVNPARRQRTWR